MARTGMEASVRAALGSVTSAAYAAAVDLAQEYGRLLDEAQALADECALIELDPRDADGRARLARLERLVAGHAAYSDLGPKLLAVLTALGATPAAQKDVKGGGQVVGIPSPLAAARDAARAHRAATVNAAAS